ncbi:MAG: peptide ABC transporter substrate-binding protein [Bdellovibrionales bacterium]
MGKLFRLFVAAAAILSFAACTKKGGGKLEYGLKLEDTLRINLESEPPSLDWSKATDTTSALVTMNIMEGLVEYNLADRELAPIPGLATEWEASNNAKTWTFKMRKGVKWTDGVEFTAQHVVDAWERLLNPDTASEYAYFLFPVKNAREYNAGKVKDFSQVGVKMNSAGDLVIELDKPLSYLPLLLTHHSTYPLRKDIVEKFGPKWTEPEHIVTLGAYKLKTWDHDKAMVLERNDNYYGEKAKIKNIIGYMINEYSTALNLMESGKLDFQRSLPFKELPKYRQMSGYRQIPLISTYYYGFNTKKPPFNNVKVRKAFAAAIDRKQVTDLLAAGHAPLSGWVPSGMFGYENERGIHFEPSAATKMLDDAGFKDRSKLPKVTIAFNTNENHQRIAENVQAQLKKNLGVEVQISNEEWKTYLARLRDDTPSIYRLGWLGDYPDPSTFMELMTSYSEQNHTGWGNKRYDELVAQGASTLDKEKRRKIYSEAQKILTEDDVPVVPIYSTVGHILLSDRVQNFPVNAIEHYLFKGVTLK